MDYMTQLLNDWSDYCEGRKDFDTGDFYALFHDEISDDYLRTALSYFPNSAELFERVKKVRAVVSRAKKPAVENDVLIGLARADLTQKREVLLYEGALEIVAAIDIARPKFADASVDLIGLKSAEPHTEFRSTITDYLDSRWISYDAKYYALFEAFYGLTTLFEIAWYLGAPLINTDVKFDHYFELWSAGGDYALTETELLVAALPD